MQIDYPPWYTLVLTTNGGDMASTRVAKQYSAYRDFSYTLNAENKVNANKYATVEAANDQKFAADAQQAA